VTRSEVAVIVVCHELGRTLTEAVESVLVQTRPPAEIVVVDDGSRDPLTLQRLSRVEGPRVRVERRPHLGVAEARNYGVSVTQSPYVVLLDADDRLDPSYLDKLASRLDAEPALDFVSCGLRAFGETRYSWTPPPCTLADQLAGGSVHISTLFRRRMWDALGGFDPSLPAHEDWDFWLTAMERGFCGAVIDEALLHYRVRAGSRYHRGICGDTYARTMGTILEKHAAAVEENAVAVLAAKKCARETQREHARHLQGRRDTLERELGRVNARIESARDELAQFGQEAIDWGDLRRVDPISPEWGLERGKPMDRHYIERFLSLSADDIRGRVLEVKDDGYSRLYGKGVEAQDIVDIDPDNPRATLVCDLTCADAIESNAYDCFILTQTLHIIYDFVAALKEAHRVLAPGGVLLATLPALSRISGEDLGDEESDFWRFTEASVRRVFAQVFGAEAFELTVCGNLTTSLGFLYGLAPDELDPAQLERTDPEYPLVFCVRAVKSAPGAAISLHRHRPNAAAILMYHRVADLAVDPHGLCVPPAQFAAQMAYLASNFHPMGLAEMGRALEAGQVPDRAVAITFDDGYLDALETASPILCEYDLPATFFLNSERLDEPHESWVDTLVRVLLAEPPAMDAISLRLPGGNFDLSIGSAEARGEAFNRLFEWGYGAGPEARNELARAIGELAGPLSRRDLPLDIPRDSHRLLTDKEIAELASRPRHTIGAHTVHHLALPEHSADVQEAEVGMNRRALENLLGRPVTLFAYPYGEFGPETVDIVRGAGFDGAVTVEARLAQPGGDPLVLPRIEVSREPLERFVEQLEGLFARPRG